MMKYYQKRAVEIASLRKLKTTSEIMTYATLKNHLWFTLGRITVMRISE